MKLKTTLGLALLSSINFCYALTSPINGTYVGVTFGPNYTTPFENVNLPIQSEYASNTDGIITITNIYPSYGGDLGLMVGRRFKDRYRLELEFASTYSVLNTIKYITTTTPTSDNVKGYVSTYGSLFVNGFVDLFPSNDFKRASPYFGLGYGQAYVVTKADMYNGDVFVDTVLKVKKSTTVAQAIVGVSYFLDDYTWLGVDGRVQRYSKIEQLGDSFTQYNINFTVNFTLDND